MIPSIYFDLQLPPRFLKSDEFKKLTSSAKDLDQSEFIHPWNDESWAKVFAKDSSYFLSFLGDRGELIGFALIQWTEGESWAHMVKIMVNTQKKGKGYGAKILKESAKHLNNYHQIEKLVFEVSIVNNEAIQFYNKMGATVLRKISQYYSDGSAALSMELNLLEIS